jgi:hypothetical protein
MPGDNSNLYYFSLALIFHVHGPDELLQSCMVEMLQMSDISFLC